MKNDNQTMDRAIPVSEQRRRKLRRIAVAVAIAVAVLGAGAWLGTQMIPTLDRKALIISEVDRGTIDVSVSATGRIVPAFEEIIVSPILRLDLQSAETDYSKALDEREIRRQQTAQLKANVETQLSDRRMQIEVKEMELSQLEAQLRNELYLDSLGSGTRDRVRQAETTLKTAQMQISQLRQQYQNEQRVRQADLRMQQLQNGIFEKGLDEKRRTLDDAKIRSPHRATLTYINSEVGSTIGAGQKIAVVSDLSHFKAECEISDSHSERVRVGGAVILRIGKERLTGIINTVTPLSQSGAITFTVVPDNMSHPRLRSGLRTEVFVITSIKDDVLRIRNGSFYSGPGDYTLFVLDGDMLHPRQVRLGECNYDYIEVISGLESGEQVIVSAYMQELEKREPIMCPNT